jgi:hypothetical protein
VIIAVQKSAVRAKPRLGLHRLQVKASLDFCRTVSTVRWNPVIPAEASDVGCGGLTFMGALSGYLHLLSPRPAATGNLWPNVHFHRGSSCCPCSQPQVAAKLIHRPEFVRYSRKSRPIEIAAARYRRVPGLLAISTARLTLYSQSLNQWQ